MEKSIKINEERCLRCGLCVKDCSAGCLTVNGDGIPVWRENPDRGCMGCQHCMTVCPVGAFSFGGVDPDTLPDAVCADPEDLLVMIRSRRSVRSYREEDVPQEKLDRIREMLSYTPTGGNLDNLHFTLIGSHEKMDEIRRTTYAAIAGLTPDSPMYHMKAFMEREQEKGWDIAYRGAPAMIACAVNRDKVAPGCDIVDPIIALTYFELFADSLGLGTLWDDFATMLANSIPELYEKLEIPDEYSLSFILVFGIPAHPYKRAAKKDAHSIRLLK